MSSVAPGRAGAPSGISKSVIATTGKLLGLLVFTWLFVFPLAMLAIGAFRSSPLSRNQRWTVEGFRTLVTDPATYSSFAASLAYAIVITALAMVVAVFFATVSTQMDIPFRRWITPMMTLLVAMPTVLYALAWSMLGAGEVGLINRALRGVGLHELGEAFDTRSWGGLIIVTVFKAGALAYLIVLGAFANQNASLEEAARISGANRARSFFTIEIPALMPALFAASLLIFVKGLEAFETPAILGLPAGIEVYATHIYGYLRGGYEANYPAASAASLVIVAVLAIAVLLQIKVTGGGKTYASIGGRSRGLELRKPGRPGLIVTLIMATYFGLALVLPIAQVILSAFQPYLGAPTLTLGNFQLLLGDPQIVQALRTTVIVSVLGGVFTVVLAFIVSYAFVRTTGKMGRYIQLASWIPAAMPGLVLGLAFLWLVLSTPGGRHIYGTVWILMVGLAVATVPLATRTLEGPMSQVTVELEEAARISGDGFLRSVFGVTGRLMTPSIIAAWFLVAITTSGILDVPILLAGTDTQLIATISFGYHSSGETVLASALYVIFTLVMALFAFVSLFISKIFRWIAFGATERAAVSTPVDTTKDDQ